MSRNSPEPISSDSEEEAVPLPGPRNRRERQVTPLGQNRDRGAAARDDDDRQNGRNAGAEAADPSFVPRGRRPDDGGNSRSPTSDGNQDEEENYPPFRFVERRDWVSRGDDGVRLLPNGIRMLKVLVANRSFRYRSALTDEERTHGILDRMQIVFRRPGGNYNKRIDFEITVIKYVRSYLAELNSRAQNNAWNRFAVDWCFSAEGIAWMNRLNDNGWTGNAASIDGHPPLDWRQDLSPATRERWTSLAAVEIVLRDALHGVPLQYIVRKIEQEGVWGQIAQAQTFRIIKQQCGAIFTLTRKTIPANEDAVNIAIYEFKHMKQGRPARLSAQFFRVLDRRAGQMLREHGEESYSFPPLRRF